jgi:hypothetical protein
MDAAAVREAHARFLDGARELDEAVAPEGQWRPELVLAHVIVAHRLIAATAARVLAGLEASFDNRAALSVPYLESVAAVAGGRDTLLDDVRRCGEELAALLERIEPEHAGAQVPTILSDGERVIVDRPLRLEELVMAPVPHLRGHSEQLQAYRAQSVG